MLRPVSSLRSGLTAPSALDVDVEAAEAALAAAIDAGVPKPAVSEAHGKVEAATAAQTARDSAGAALVLQAVSSGPLDVTRVREVGRANGTKLPPPPPRGLALIGARVPCSL